MSTHISDPNPRGLEHLSPAYPGRAPWGTAERLRAWQQEAIQQYFASTKRDYLVSATPGAGKTTFALRLAKQLLDEKTVTRLVVVAPTEHLKYQWADAASRAFIKLNPDFSNTKASPVSSFDGVVVTYAQVSSQPWRHRVYTEAERTLVIFDEIHHAGEALSWGDALRDAYSGAERRIALTGTPFRSDSSPIPFINYQQTPRGDLISATDFSYSYDRALADGVVRPIIFLSYSGMMRWRTTSGEEYSADLSHPDTKDITAQALRTALDPTGEWVPQVFRAANRRLTEIRRHFPDAGGLVIASNQATARAYAKVMEEISGEKPTVVLSDDSASSDRITQFSEGTSRWMIAVKMVSEGVDVPRLMVGVYATNAATPLYFTQAIGRFVRTKRKGETATIFLPSVKTLLGYAAELDVQRNHIIQLEPPDEVLLDDLDAAEAELDAELGIEAEHGDAPEYEFQVVSSLAEFDHAMYSGSVFGIKAAPTTPEEEEFLGLPGLLEPEQIRQLLEHREARQRRRMEVRRSLQGGAGQQPAQPVPLYRNLREQRQLLKTLVNRYSRVTNEPQAFIYTQLRNTAGGPEVGKASVAQLEERITLINRWLNS